MTGQAIAVEWRGAAVAAALEQELERRLDRAANELADRTRQLIGEPARDDRPSAGPPRRRTGSLQESLFVDADRPLARRMGTDLDYGRWLETGTERMPPHPYLTRVLDESLSRLRDQLTAGID
jgi:hypothetical protein